MGVRDVLGSLFVGLTISSIAVYGQGVRTKPAPPPPPPNIQIKFFVDTATTPVSPEGFVDSSDKWLVDSKSDIIKALDRKYFYSKTDKSARNVEFHLASSSTVADLVVTVAARGINTQAFGERTTMSIYRNVVLADTVPTVGVTRWVSIVLSVGPTYKKEVAAWSTNRSRFSAGAWSADAKQLALEVAGWALLNEAKILELQGSRHAE